MDEDARYDGLWVLRTDTDFEPMVVALAYKQLWMVEDIFRTMKAVLETRPVYHRTDRCIRGHVFCSFLALVRRQELQRRLGAKRWALEPAEVAHDLHQLHETTIEIDDDPYVVRSETKGTIGKLFQACGVAIPPALRPAGHVARIVQEDGSPCHYTNPALVSGASGISVGDSSTTVGA